MADKKEVPDGWPLVTGDYEVGDPQSCVAISSNGSYFHMEHLKGVAIQGPDKTENIGLEKIITNVISNPNIRFLIAGGAEVPGHVSGGTLIALVKGGVDPSSHKVVGSTGAIPFIENLPDEAVARFRDQVEVIDMIGEEDYGKINAKVQELIARDPGAYPEDAMVVKIGGEGEEAAKIEMPLAMPASPHMATIDRATEQITYKTQLIARDQKLTSGLSMNGLIGLLVGFLATLIFLLPLIMGVI
ncbi:tetrahydromethanopterin S-methyltransferase subunit A [Candidatus Methanophagaceae archaeon]|nr:tetrahydromethanopterin S-methyltransferase subunit A [Methanophagales archaeon]